MNEKQRLHQGESPGGGAAIMLITTTQLGCLPAQAGGYYCPDSFVPRAQMTIFLVRTFNLP